MIAVATALALASCQSGSETNTEVGAGADSAAGQEPAVDGDPNATPMSAPASGAETVENADGSIGDDELVDRDTDGAAGGGSNDQSTTSGGGTVSKSTAAPSKSTLAETGSVSRALLSDAIADSVDQSTFSFVGNVVIESAENPTSAAEILFSGQSDQAAAATEVAVDLSNLGNLMDGGDSDGDGDRAFLEMFFADPIEIIQIGETSWINWGLFSIFASPESGGEEIWLEVSSADGGAMAGELGSDFGIPNPLDLLDVLRESAGDVDNLGGDVVRGVDVTHYRMTVNLQDLVGSLPANEQVDREAASADLDHDVPVDFWLGSDGYLRRVTLSLEAPESRHGDASLTRIDVELFNFGETLEIQPPPPDQVLTQDDLGFDLSEELSEQL